ncbi:hypothetical protein [Actinomadura rudentiformis]|uniref:Uncharacterized protein n=1 Tax=Actinomadura rudentiformis TaxID=359158 RepID=A0A6H9YED0_9ACTN|nr:hypothetical protein [Actinomadura rudentiformis]KAB2344131.1 hypothetical protein F8566_33005 [Actinomadura rudentiformis]
MVISTSGKYVTPQLYVKDTKSDGHSATVQYAVWWAGHKKPVPWRSVTNTWGVGTAKYETSPDSFENMYKILAREYLTEKGKIWGKAGPWQTVYTNRGGGKP